MQSALALEVPAETTAEFNGSTRDPQTARKALDDLISVLSLIARVLN
jgi:hypothetical protein